MWNALAFLKTGFRAAYVKPAENLDRVIVDDFAVEGFGNRYGEIRFASSPSARQPR